MQVGSVKRFQLASYSTDSSRNLIREIWPVSGNLGNTPGSAPDALLFASIVSNYVLIDGMCISLLHAMCVQHHGLIIVYNRPLVCLRDDYRVFHIIICVCDSCPKALCIQLSLSLRAYPCSSLHPYVWLSMSIPVYINHAYMHTCHTSGTPHCTDEPQ